MPKEKKLNIGGQAVIEGVMIRGMKHNITAVRSKNKIITKHDKIKQRKGKFYKLPIARGFYNLVDMLVLGTRSLMWSADQQLEEKEKITKKEMTFSFLFAFLFGIGLFVILPYFATNLIGFFEESQPLFFNLIDGMIRITVFFIYIFAISLMKDVQILFKYHGAEHMAIHCYEKGKKLTVDNIKKFSTLHPRCGTAFIMIVLVASILVFSIITPVLLTVFPGLLKMSAFPRRTILVVVRILLIPIIAGLSYEFLKFSAKNEKHSIMRVLIWPGLLMQKVTTKRPNKKQIEVAKKAVEKIIRLEKGKAL